MTVDEETVLYTLAERMALVRWERVGEAQDHRRFITISRRVKLFSDVPGRSQPACYQAEHGTTEDQITGMPYRSIVEANWIIYQDVSKDKKGIGAIENNLILGGIRAALAPFPQDPGYSNERNTLNGLVHHCYISGKIFKDPGDIDGQGMMVIPIKVLVP